MLIFKNVNIGENIKKVISEKGISQAQLGRLLETSPNQITRLLKKETIDTDSLIDVSKAVNYNFFDDFMPKVEIEGTEFPVENADEYAAMMVKVKEGHQRRGFLLTYPHIGNCITERLKVLKITQSELAGFLGVTPQEVSRLLKNNSMDTGKLNRISEILGYNFFGEFYTWNYDDDLIAANEADNIMSEYLGTERVYYSGIKSITGMFEDPALDKFRLTIKNMFDLINMLYKENTELKNRLKQSAQNKS